MAKTPVSTIGKYQVIELIGEGAMGTVYRALDPVLNRSVAIKVMSDAIARDGTLRDRFMREAQAAGSLQHPNVVTIYDFGEFEGHLFIAMEYVDGIDLEEMIEKHVPMTLDQRLGIAIDVLVGLSYAHKRGVVHRDIKPANVRVTEDGRAKIMDFGVAHLESAKMTATGVMVGTPNYMAPEQVTGQKVTPATDIFSVGAVLYELLAHRKAFGADSLHNVLFKVMSEDPPPLAIVAPELPPGFDPIVRRALAKEAADRYQSAQEMANELTALRAKVVGSKESSLSLGATIASITAEHAARQARARMGRAWSTPRVLAAAVVLGVGLVGGTWLIASRGTRDARSVDGDSSGVVGPTTLETTPQIAVVPSPAGEKNADTATLLPPRTPANGAPRAEPRQATTVATDREIATVDSVHQSAMRARAAAARAGATDVQLASGDAQLAQGLRLRDQRQYVRAVASITAATTSWANVARDLREAAMLASRESTKAAERRTDSTPTRPGGTVAQPPVVPAPLPSSPASPPSSSTAPPPVTKLEPEPPPLATAIAAVVAEYARAIDARDLAAIRAVYPTITEDQQRGFQRFFQSVRSVNARLTASSPQGDGNTATARVSGAYDYVDSNGRTQREAVSFTATFRRDGARWRIVSTVSTR